MNLEPGYILDGKYRIVKLLGTGGMGAVYEGENARIRRRVAIKLLHASVSAQSESVTRFEREAQAAARIGSEHICEVLDLGNLPDGTRYMVMEYLDGESLSSRIKRLGRLSPMQTIPLMSQILDALGAAHSAGIIHRDLKPDNVFILRSKGGTPDFVKILDFGVSKFSQLSGEGEEMTMTRAGAVVGTPYYMSPEQARGMSKVDARSDIYALGVLLYQAVTGQVPYQATTFNELLFKIVLEPAPPPQHFVPDLDADFTTIIQRAMAREPEQRFQTCQDFKDTLVQWSAARQNAALLSAPGMSPVMPMHSPPAWQPPLGNTGSGQQAALQQSQPGMMPGGPMMAGGPGLETANSWGNASSPGPVKRSNGAVVAAVFGAIVLLVAGGAAAFFLVGRPSGATPAGAGTGGSPMPNPPASAAASSAEPSATATAAATAAAATASAAASASEAPTASAQVEPPPAKTTTPAVPIGPRGVPATPKTGKPVATAKPGKPGSSGDFGY